MMNRKFPTLLRLFNPMLQEEVMLKIAYVYSIFTNIWYSDYWRNVASSPSCSFGQCNFMDRRTDFGSFYENGWG